MKRSLLVGALAGLLACGAAVSAMAQARARPVGAKVNMTAQPAGPEPASPVPTGDLVLGTVRLPKAVTADGKPLAAGTYQVKLTAAGGRQNPVGQTATYERWAEFVPGRHGQRPRSGQHRRQDRHRQDRREHAAGARADRRSSC